MALPNRIPIVQVCDATGAAFITTAGNTKKAADPSITSIFRKNKLISSKMELPRPMGLYAILNLSYLFLK